MRKKKFGNRRRFSEIKVNQMQLASDNSYGIPTFVQRGYYVDQEFRCKECGRQEIWTAEQQQWWYEVAKGGVWTTAIRCRPCRRKEQERKAEHRQRSEAGRILKARSRQL